MDILTATQLVKNGIGPASGPQTWCDLGTGSGLFCTVLASLLPHHSTIYAVDKDLSSFDAGSNERVRIVSVEGDFQDPAMLPHNADGILLANALHYVKNQAAFLSGLGDILTPEGRLIIIEYEMRGSNPWVPYPVPFDKLKKLLANSFDVHKLSEIPSRFNRAMYSAVARRSIPQQH